MLLVELNAVKKLQRTNSQAMMTVALSGLNNYPPLYHFFQSSHIVIYYQASSIIYSEHFTIFCIILRI